MKRCYALWRTRESLGSIVVALCLPLAAAAVPESDWAGVPRHDGAYFLASEVPADPADVEAPDFAMPTDDMPYGDETSTYEDCVGGCECDCHSSCWCAENLLCDNWAGPMAKCGVGADFELTQFFQGVASGGQEQNWEYGGKLDYFFTFDGAKMGLWDGASAAMHAETRFGDSVIFDAVGLAPVNANMLYPSAVDNDTAITGFLINQQLNEAWIASAGKYNAFDLWEQLYPQTGRGIDGFMNTSAFLPVTFARTINLSFMGVGFTKVSDRGVEAAVIVHDTKNVATTSGFDGLFDNGAVILGAYRLFHDWNGLPGSNAVIGVYSSGTYTDLDPTSITILPDSGLAAGQKTGSWNIEYVLDQKLWTDCCNPERNIGLLTMWGIADENPSPIRWSGNVAIQAQGINASRPADTMGVAWFHTGLSDTFTTLVRPVLNLHDVSGVETYYNAAITPWFHLTGDLQVVEPANISNDTALVLGLRANFAL
jgi:porin